MFVIYDVFSSNGHFDLKFRIFSEEICGQISMKNFQIQNENDTVRRKNPLF